jgi:four helix bundle protein
VEAAKRKADSGEEKARTAELPASHLPPPAGSPHWRFEDLEIWKLARDLAVKFHGVAAQLEQRKLYRYAEQLRGAGLSMANNIAEGSGSLHAGEFRQFLNIARRSTFENASMLLVFEAMNILTHDEIVSLLNDCDKLSRMITNYSRTR